MFGDSETMRIVSSIGLSPSGPQPTLVSTGLRTLVPAVGVKSCSFCWISAGSVGISSPAAPISSDASTLYPPPPPTMPARGPGNDFR